MNAKMALVSSLSHSNASAPGSLHRPDGASTARSISNVRRVEPAGPVTGALARCVWRVLLHAVLDATLQLIPM